ncbi:MAG: hypothetical protein D6722_15665 [Bacteroidetes bacterium]|nr:MAG: hypothetical protein D6722_15665 [Bacteroidota bacterium]
MQPPKYKTALIVWLAIYPLITVVLWLFGPYLAALPLPLRTLLLTGILVPTMVYVAIPFWQRVLRPWLIRS